MSMCVCVCVREREREREGMRERERDRERMRVDKIDSKSRSGHVFISLLKKPRLRNFFFTSVSIFSRTNKFFSRVLFSSGESPRARSPTSAVSGILRLRLFPEFVPNSFMKRWLNGVCLKETESLK